MYCLLVHCIDHQLVNRKSECHMTTLAIHTDRHCSHIDLSITVQYLTAYFKDKRTYVYAPFPFLTEILSEWKLIFILSNLIAIVTVLRQLANIDLTSCVPQQTDSLIIYIPFILFHLFNVESIIAFLCWVLASFNF